MPRCRLCPSLGRYLSLAFIAVMASSVARADQTPRPAPAGSPAPLQSTAAFERAYAASFYQFDACGDSLAGRTFRRVLEVRVDQCPFSAAAKARFHVRLAAQRRQSSRAMSQMIENNGGLPVRLEGMTRTCREQTDSPEYRTVHDRLEAFSTGKAAADAVIAEPCDAVEISP